MFFIILNLICWIITFIFGYIILNPNIKAFKKFHKSPYKKIIQSDLDNSFNVIPILEKKSIKELAKKYQHFKNNFKIIIFNFNGGLNVGTIMRTACVYGCDKFFIIGRKIYDSRSCVGSNKFVDLNIVKNIVTGLPDKNEKPIINYNKFKEFLICNKLSPIFVEQGGNNIHEFNFNEHLHKISDYKPTFIFGNETFGIEPELIRLCKDVPGSTIISIPQPGMLKSLNVANSSSIILWEFYRQTLYKNNIRDKYNLMKS